MQWQREEAVDKVIKSISIYDGDSSTIQESYDFHIFEFDNKREVVVRK